MGVAFVLEMTTVKLASFYCYAAAAGLFAVFLISMVDGVVVVSSQKSDDLIRVLNAELVRV